MSDDRREHLLEPASTTLVSQDQTGGPLILADYPFLGVLWSMLVFFVWVAWFLLLFKIVGDIFRRRDIGGGAKTLWLIFVLFLPFLGVFVYLIANNDEMAQRDMERAQAAQAQFNDYVQQAAGSGGAAAEIDKAKKLLDSGAINESEFAALKAKALAT
jgi:hypothetical protein